MKKRDSLGRQLTINDFKQKVKVHESDSLLTNESDSVISKAVDEFAHYIDSKTDEAIVAVINELGFTARLGMSLDEYKSVVEEMKAEGITLEIQTEWNTSTHKVIIQVIQEARVLSFDLENDNEKENVE